MKSLYAVNVTGPHGKIFPIYCRVRSPATAIQRFNSRARWHFFVSRFIPKTFRRIGPAA